jgi:hypothetical protein
VQDGVLQKVCRKGLGARNVYLFNDILVYGTPTGGGSKNKAQNVIILQDCIVTDVDDSAEGSNGFQINSGQKSFLVYAESAQDKTTWTANLKKYCELSRAAAGMEGPVDARAVWISDHKVKACMMQDCAANFTMTNRRHHCRNCGKCVCGKCSKEKAILNQEKPERVCIMCFRKLGGSAENPVPKLGKASTESTAADEEDSDASSDDDSGDEDGGGGAIAGSSAAALAGVAGDADLSKSEKKMHDLSDEERKQLMTMVKDGTLTMDEALKKIEGGVTAGADAGADGDVPAGVAHAIALYANDDPEGPDELMFQEDQIIILTRRVNEEWLEGYINGADESSKGIFPTAFVEVKVPL